jgi:hypothetical protein
MPVGRSSAPDEEHHTGQTATSSRRTGRRLPEAARELVVVVEVQYAAPTMLPSRRRPHRMRWGRTKDLALKALKKLAGPRVPASVKALERPLERMRADHRTTVQAIAPATPTAVHGTRIELTDEPGDEAVSAIENEPDRVGREG